jgi:hypothetical protein
MSANEHEQDADLSFEAPPLREDDNPDAEPAQEPEPIEGDDDDAQHDDAPEPDDAPKRGDASDHFSPEQMESAAKKTETSFKTYTRAVERNYDGLPVALVECPLCPDQHKGFVNAHAAGYVPQEIQDAVQLFFGIAREQDYELDTDYSECPKCKGRGKVALPTHVAGKDTMTCRRCDGRGYLPPASELPTNGHVETGPMVYGHEPVATMAYDEVDEWDEPRILPDGRENPNFGKMPNRKIPVEPWGVTAGLNAMSPTG